MPADLFSTIMLILVTAADDALRLGPFVVGGIALSLLLHPLALARAWAIPRRPRALHAPLVAIVGMASPIPTISTLPLVLRLRGDGLPQGIAVTFVLASSLMNPQILLLTLGVMGTSFVLLQVIAVLLLSTTLGYLLKAAGDGSPTNGAAEAAPNDQAQAEYQVQARSLAEHVILHFLVGVIIAAGLQVLIPQLRVLHWLSQENLLPAPILGSLGAVFYSCGGSAVPLAGGLARIGVSTGTLFSFLFAGPALRGRVLASLSCLFSKRAMVICMAIIFLFGGASGYVVEWILGAV